MDFFQALQKRHGFNDEISDEEGRQRDRQLVRDVTALGRQVTAPTSRINNAHAASEGAEATRHMAQDVRARQRDLRERRLQGVNDITGQGPGGQWVRGFYRILPRGNSVWVRGHYRGR